MAGQCRGDRLGGIHVRLHDHHIAGHLVEDRPADRSGNQTGQTPAAMGPDDEHVSVPDPVPVSYTHLTLPTILRV